MMKALYLCVVGLWLSLFLLACSPKPVDTTLFSIAVAEDERLLAVDSLDKWVTHPDSIVRAHAAYAIGIVGQESAYPALRNLLTDDNASVLTSAAFAAGQVGDSTVVDLLVALSDSNNPDVKRVALEALSKIGGTAASARLTQVMGDANEELAIRAQAATWMFRLKDDASRDALIAQAGATEDQIRTGVYYALARRGAKEAKPAFLKGLEDPDEQIQIFAINGLSRINDTASAEPIAPMLLSTNVWLQYYAVNFVSKFAYAEALPSVLKLTRPTNNPYVRIAATQALGKIKSDQSALTLMELLNDPDQNVACAALVSYAAQGRGDARKFAALFSGAAESRRRIAAVQALSTIGGDTSLALMESLLTDPVPAVRGEALDQMLAAANPEVRDRILEAGLNDSDFMPVVLAASYIGTNRLMNYIPRLCDLYVKTRVYENKQTVLDVFIELADSVIDKAPLAAISDSARHDAEFSIRARGRELARKLMLKIPGSEDHFRTDITPESYARMYERSDKPQVKIQTSRGDIVLELYPRTAPKTVANYLALVGKGFYNNRVWHRVVPDFVIQDGCPRGDGWGSPGYEIRCEYNRLPFERGSLGMATSGKDTGGSQYFICQSAQPHLDGRYTVFGKVISGLEIVDQIQLDDSIRAVTVINAGETK